MPNELRKILNLTNPEERSVESPMLTAEGA